MLVNSDACNNTQCDSAATLMELMTVRRTLAVLENHDARSDGSMTVDHDVVDSQRPRRRAIWHKDTFVAQRVFMSFCAFTGS